MELFDVIDSKGNPAGQIVSREKAHAEGIPHRTAHIWIIRKKEGRVQILLQKRSQNKDSFPGKFDTSSAGHIQAGDEPLESALRELKEELGISATPEQLHFAGTFPISFAKEFHGKMFRDEEIAFVYIYREPVNTAELVLQTEEVEEVQWFDLEEVYEQCGKHREIFCVPAISVHWQTLFSLKEANVGCVAEHKTTVVSQNCERKFTAKLKSSVHLTGNACTSSNIIMLLHNVCILRIQLF